METKLLPAGAPGTVEAAASILRRGGVVAVPTETVYGLAADGLNAAAVARIFEAKGRPQDNPLILHVAAPEEIEAVCHSIPAAAWRLAEAFWPGPLTMVLPCRDTVPPRTTAGLDTVAVRCPRCEVTRAIIRAAGAPLAAPSANRSGKPSTTTAAHVLHDMDGRIDAIVDGGPCQVGVESTIVDLSGEAPRLLRPGGVTAEALRAMLGELIVDRAVTAPVDRDAVVRAPGMKYKHYAPQGQVLIVDGPREAAAAYIRRRLAPGDAILCFREELALYEGCGPTAYGSEADPATLARGLFAALRDLDRPEVKTIYARCPQGGGMARAVQNRLGKAAGFRLIRVDAP